MSDKHNQAMSDWLDQMKASHGEPSPRPGLPRQDQVPEVSGAQSPSQDTAHPAMTPVTSSNIAGVAHDGQALWVKFLNGTVYRYPTAGADLHAGMVAAGSPGSYFAKHVKSAHKGEKVT